MGNHRDCDGRLLVRGLCPRGRDVALAKRIRGSSHAVTPAPRVVPAASVLPERRVPRSVLDRMLPRFLFNAFQGTRSCSVLLPSMKKSREVNSQRKSQPNCGLRRLDDGRSLSIQGPQRSDRHPFTEIPWFRILSRSHSRSQDCNRRYLTVLARQRRILLKFAMHPSEPDESNCSVAGLTYFVTVRVTRFASRFAAYRIATIVTEIPD